MGQPLGVANRRWRETEGLIGMIINNVVLRTSLSDNPTFRELLAQVREGTLEAYAHQDVPFDSVVEALQPVRDMSRNPLFQAMFSFHDAPLPALELPELTVSLLEGLSNESTKFDLNVVAIPRSEQRVGLSPKAGADGITVIWEYNTDLFDPDTMIRLLLLRQYKRRHQAAYYSANIKGDIKQLNSLWDGESKDLMAWRRIPSSAYRPGSRASRLSMPE